MMERIREHVKKYPKARPCDMVKLLYQSEFGGGHMMKDREYVLNRLKSETDTVKQTEVCMFEEIGGGLLRMDLRGIQASGLRMETVAGLFMATARRKGSREGLEEKIMALCRLADGQETPFSREELDGYLAEYRDRGMPAVSHSEEYRSAYKPAYRLVPEETKKYLPLFREIDARLREKGMVSVRIDGDCAGGKSTLGALLAEVYDGQLLHMDDYFLPFDRKTPERLAQPGGNVDYERFAREIEGCEMNGPVRYRPFSCQSGQLLDWVELPPAPVRIVEGVYSLHPELQWPDISVFLAVDPEMQRERIRKRNGEKMLQRFEREWIPMEKRYFAAFGIREKCDFCFEA